VTKFTAVSGLLDELSPSVVLDEPTWSDVLARAEVLAAKSATANGHVTAWTPRRPLLRPLVLAVALALAAILAAAAYAVVRYVIVGSPAPPSVKADEKLLNTVKGELIPRVHPGSGIEVAKTQAAAVLRASTGPVYLWVAPTIRGGYCAFLQIAGVPSLPDGRANLSGGCTNPPRPRISIGFQATRVHDGRLLGLVVGYAAPPARRVRVRFASGSTHTFTLSASGFVLAEIDPSDQVRTITALDKRGIVVAREDLRALPLQVPKPTGPTRTVATLRLLGSHRAVVLRVWPGPGGIRCITLLTPGGTSKGCGARPVKPDQLDVAPAQIGAAPHGFMLLWGAVGGKIKTVHLRFQDGRQIRLEIHHGYVLYQVNPRNFAAGHRPITLVGTDSTGQTIATHRLGPWRQ
jgi:hypothetical protein